MKMEKNITRSKKQQKNENENERIKKKLKSKMFIHGNIRESDSEWMRESELAHKGIMQIFTNCSSQHRYQHLNISQYSCEIKTYRAKVEKFEARRLAVEHANSILPPFIFSLFIQKIIKIFNSHHCRLKIDKNVQNITLKFSTKIFHVYFSFSSFSLLSLTQSRALFRFVSFKTTPWVIQRRWKG
jgi:hypothetical protein